MNEMLRTFIAVELPDELHKELGALQEKLKSAGSDTAWVKPENIHITLKFLGNVAKDRIEEIKKSLDLVAKDEVPFNLRAGGVGAFPKPSYPRVIWAGLEESQRLKSLAEKVEGALEQLGFQKEGRAFSPHLTLGRVKSPKNKDRLASLLEKTQFTPGVVIAVDKIILFQSILAPGGSIYTPLHEARFKPA